MKKHFHLPSPIFHLPSSIFHLLAALLLAAPAARAATAWPIRLVCDQAVRSGIPLDLNTGGSPLFTRGDDLEFQLGFFENGTLVTNWGNVALVTLSIYVQQNDTNPPLISTNCLIAAINTNLTATNWTNGLNQVNSTNQHADIFIPAALSEQCAAVELAWRGADQ